MTHNAEKENRRKIKERLSQNEVISSCGGEQKALKCFFFFLSMLYIIRFCFIIL
jgi:hypothetical protein